MKKKPLTTITVQLTEQLKKKLDKAAYNQEISMALYVRLAIADKIADDEAE